MALPKPTNELPGFCLEPISGGNLPLYDLVYALDGLRWGLMSIHLMRLH